MLFCAVISHVLAFVLIIALPVWDRFETRRLKTSRNPRVKIQSYQMTIAWLWICAIIAVAAFGLKTLWTIHPTTTEVPWLPSGSGGYVYGGALAAAFLAATLIPVLASWVSPKIRDGFAKQLAPLSFFLPTTGDERLWFAMVSISAGVCEEVLFRGFLIRYFQAGPYHLAMVFAALLACLFFGTAHLYQGIVGVVQTTFMGVAFAAMFFATGSLILPVLAHVAIDLRVLLILRKAPGCALQQDC